MFGLTENKAFLDDLTEEETQELHKQPWYQETMERLEKERKERLSGTKESEQNSTRFGNET